MHSAHQLKLAVFTQDASWNGSISNAMTYCKMELLCWFWSTENEAGHWRTGLSHPIWKLAVLLLSTLRFGNIRIQPAEQPGRYEEK